MSSTPTVMVTINPDASAEVSVDGVLGKKCTDYTGAISRALGGRVLKDTKKPEYDVVIQNPGTVRT